MFSSICAQNIKSKNGEKHLKVQWILECQNKQTNKSTTELYTGITSGLFFPLHSAITVIASLLLPMFQLNNSHVGLEDLIDMG